MYLQKKMTFQAIFPHLSNGILELFLIKFCKIEEISISTGSVNEKEKNIFLAFFRIVSIIILIFAF